MKPYYESWKKSNHSVAAETCVECHVKPGFLNLLYYRLLFWREIYAESLDKEIKPLKTYIPGTKSCVKWSCHSLNRMKSISGDINIDHRKHVSQFEIECVDCHPGIIHAGIGNVGPGIPPRTLCFECHGTQKGNCYMCHNKPVDESRPYEH